MKKYLSLPTVLFIVLAVAVVVNTGLARAEDGKTSTGVENSNLKTIKSQIKNDLQAKREEMKKKIETVRAENKTKLEGLRENIKNEKDTAKAKIKEMRMKGREMALQKFDDAVGRIGALEVKVNTAIAKLKAKGIDTTGAESLVATADTKLTEAKDKIGQMNTLLVVSINELSADNKAKLRTLAQGVQTLLKDIHSSLNNAIKSLRDAMKAKIGTKTETETTTGTDDQQITN